MNCFFIFSFCRLKINLKTPKVAPLRLVGDTRSLFFVTRGFFEVYVSGFDACRTLLVSLLSQLNRSWAWLTNTPMPQPLSVLGCAVKAKVTFLIALCPRLSVSKKAVPVSGGAISWAWITTDIFKHSTVYCTSKVVQANGLTRWVIVAPLLTKRPYVINVSKVSSFWSHTCSADELVSLYFGPGSLNDKEITITILTLPKISWARRL